MQRILKPLLVITAGFALLLVSAVPSGASSGNVTGGSLSVNLVPPLTSSLVPGTGPCPSGPVSTLTVTSSGSGPSYPISATLNVPSSAFDYQGDTYFLVASGTSSSGSVDPSAGTASAVVPVTAQIYRETAPGSCVADTTPVCTGPIATRLTLSGTFSGTVTPPAVVGTTTLSGSGRTSVLGCALPFAALNGKTVTISSLTATLS